ncbi:polyphosphate kinase 2, PA0141 family [Nitrosomonas marina]|uniref:ADP/GDP-polyphosphate phosphotransferase n=1 Tax=Nitrosomonas marina TaxID=917 RepID=A0A1I0CK88_9PROT|nr:polyphosphate kinase 2 [Nitrosomonas marina]SET20044.1 polyphosphate kinase 2, PA0141 family [Nitrosomonas marina]
MDKKLYKQELYALQVELVKFHKSVIENGRKVCLLFEGRDAAGKDGTIKRFSEHLSPREVRTVALGAPSDREKSAWYFQRFVPHLPVSGEIVFFNRSWYNRAGVEKVMKFCRKNEYLKFMNEVANFEHLLTHADLVFFKYYLDISKQEQKKRLSARREDPLKQWKISPIDEKAQALWQAYSEARDAMFAKTNFVFAPWYIVHSDNKKRTRINVMKHFLSHVDYKDKNNEALIYDSSVVFEFDPVCYEKGMIAS